MHLCLCLKIVKRRHKTVGAGASKEGVFRKSLLKSQVEVTGGCRFIEVSTRMGHFLEREAHPLSWSNCEELDFCAAQGACSGFV